MQFNISDAILLLQRTPKVLNTLLENLPKEWTHNNEGPNTWSPYDIIGHLIHGEKTDWIPRAKIILGDSVDKSFIPFDRFAQFNLSQGKTLQTLLVEFEDIRNENVEILKSMNLTDEDLELKGVHPDFGEVTLKQLLSTWTVHDLSHINQITRVMMRNYRTEVGPWSQFISLLK